MRNQMFWHMKIHTAEDRHECPECKKVCFIYRDNILNWFSLTDVYL